MKIAYLCSRYPAISHTFILREVLALREASIDVHTFTIRRVPSTELLSEIDRLEDQRTQAILPVGPMRLLAAHVRVLAGNPASYLRALGTALRDRPAGLRNALWYMYYFAEAGLLANELRRRGIAHIHAHFANVASNVARLAAMMTGGTWSLTIHGQADFGDPVASRLCTKIASAAFTACVSDFGRAQAMMQCNPAHWNRIHRVYCGIDPRRFQPSVPRKSDAASATSTEPLRILTVGRLSPEKGHGILLEAIGELHNRGVHVHSTLVGDGPERSHLEALTARLGIGAHTTFTGSIGQNRIAEVYSAADVFVLPSFSEGLPVVLMEAMASGLPAVASRITGIPELIEDGVDGLLVTPGRPDLLADAIAALADNPSRRRNMAKSALAKIAREFDARVTVQPLIGLFRNLLVPDEPRLETRTMSYAGAAVRTAK